MMLGRSKSLMLIYLIVVSSLAYYSHFSSQSSALVEGQGYGCSVGSVCNYECAGNCARKVYLRFYMSMCL